MMLEILFAFIFLLAPNPLLPAQEKIPIQIITINPTQTPTPTLSPTPTFTPTPTPSPIPTYTPTPTLTATPIPTITTSQSLEEMFAKYGAMYGVDKELLKKIASCESGFNPNATNGDYMGLFQFASLTWIGARIRLGASEDLNLRLNAEESIRTAAHEISYKGTSGWSNCD